jgi:hypothetical protein
MCTFLRGISRFSRTLIYNITSVQNRGRINHYAPNLDSLNGYLTSSSFLSQICFFFLLIMCSTQTCFAFSFMNFRMYRGSQSSLATPRSLQHRMRALDLQPSVAVGIPSGSKYCCSPRATETSLKKIVVSNCY